MLLRGAMCCLWLTGGYLTITPPGFLTSYKVWTVLPWLRQPQTVAETSARLVFKALHIEGPSVRALLDLRRLNVRHHDVPFATHAVQSLPWKLKHIPWLHPTKRLLHSVLKGLYLEEREAAHVDLNSNAGI